MTRFTPAALYELTFIDVSQFVVEPLRTGVQRVLMKVIEHMPRERIMPFRVVDENHVAILDPAVFDFGIRYFQHTEPTKRAAAAASHGKPISLSEDGLLIKLVGSHPLAIIKAERFFAHAERIINLEAFSRPARSMFYASCPPEHRAKIFHFIHDLLVFEAPEVFPQLNWRYASDYVLLFAAYCAAGGFLVASAELAGRVAHYFNRPLADVRVVHFGGDLTPASGRPGKQVGRRSVVVLGTIEPRKYPRTVVEALFRLAAYHPQIDCTLIGKWGWVDAPTRAAIEQLLAAGRITHHEQLADHAATRLMAAADVGIYVSSHEGFGLPVIEFAALGVPLVSNEAVPSAKLVGTRHATILHHVGVKELVTAVEWRLAQPAPAAPYYTWTWADCAREIFTFDRPRRGRGSGLDGQRCWQYCTRLVRALRQGEGEGGGEGHGAGDCSIDTVTRLVQRRFAANTRAVRDITRNEANFIPPAQMAALVEAVSEAVYDNRHLIQWAELAQVRGKLAELVRSLAAETHLAGLSRAYMAFVGRQIDPRAAAEALRMAGVGTLFDRIVDLIGSQEAAAWLGPQGTVALRHVVGEVREAVAMCLAPQVDLLALSDWLRTPPPTLQDVMLADELLRSDVDRLELLLYLAHPRPVTGDALDLFLEVLAEFCHQRRLRIGALGGIVVHDRWGGLEEASPATFAMPMTGRGDPPMHHAMEPRSFMCDVPLLSESFDAGWHAAEHGDGRMFRWMMREGIVINPQAARPVHHLILDITGVYGTREPLLVGWLGDTQATVRVDEKPGSDGWHVHLTSEQEGTLAPTVRIQALASDSPARAEGAADAREISLCVTSATFVYQD